MSTPTEPGIYWARRYKDGEWYSLLVVLAGKPPFLKVTCCYDRCVETAEYPPPDPASIVFGPRLVEQEVPHGEIIKTSK